MKDEKAALTVSRFAGRWLDPVRPRRMMAMVPMILILWFVRSFSSFVGRGRLMGRFAAHFVKIAPEARKKCLGGLS